MTLLCDTCGSYPVPIGQHWPGPPSASLLASSLQDPPQSPPGFCPMTLSAGWLLPIRQVQLPKTPLPSHNRHCMPHTGQSPIKRVCHAYTKDMTEEMMTDKNPDLTQLRIQCGVTTFQQTYTHSSSNNVALTR